MSSDQFNKQQIRMTCALLFHCESALNITNVQKYNHNCSVRQAIRAKFMFQFKMHKRMQARARTNIIELPPIE